MSVKGGIVARGAAEARDLLRGEVLPESEHLGDAAPGKNTRTRGSTE